MGSFYVNITLRGLDQKDIVDKLVGLKRKAFVSPTENGFTTVYDFECDSQDEKAIKQVAKILSGDFACQAWAVLNHDDDILAYWLYDSGTLIDEYNSTPGYFDGEDEMSPPKGGDAKTLVDFMGGTGDAAVVEGILRSHFSEDFEDMEDMMSSGYVFAVERHEALVNALGLPAFTVGFGHEYLSRGEVPEGYSKDGVVTARRIKNHRQGKPLQGRSR